MPDHMREDEVAKADMLQKKGFEPRKIVNQLVYECDAFLKGTCLRMKSMPQSDYNPITVRSTVRSQSDHTFYQQLEIFR